MGKKEPRALTRDEAELATGAVDLDPRTFDKAEPPRTFDGGTDQATD